MNEDQVDRLEMKIAFQEDLLQKLDDAVFAQQQQILLLEDPVRVRFMRKDSKISRLTELTPKHGLQNNRSNGLGLNPITICCDPRGPVGITRSV